MTAASLAALGHAHRRALMKRLPDGLIVVSAAGRARRSGDVDYPYRQDSTFLWLAGVQQPGYVLLLDPKSGGETLFCPHLTQEHAVWMGHIPNLAETRRMTGIREVLYVDDFVAMFRKRGKGKRPVYTDRPSAALVRKALSGAIIDRSELEEAVSELRIVKDDGEIALLRTACEATEQGYATAFRCAKDGTWEWQVEAELERAFRLAGCPEVAFESIVAAGRNSAVLHYHANSAPLLKGDLILVDAGAEFHGYAADFTRTFPVDGRFTPKQRGVYEAVLRAQEACIDICREGRTSLELQRKAEETLAEGLVDLGLLKGSVEDLVDSEATRVFFPHGIGHPLGLDVHDVKGGRRRQLPKGRSGRLRFRTRLEPGFVVTIEPGLYFIEALIRDVELRKKHRGLVDWKRAEGYLDFGGVRIEDDLVIQAGGAPALNLTRTPKTVEAIEAACAG